MPKAQKTSQSIAAIDLFCGAGGLTHGLVKAGISVVCGVDVDPVCRFPYEQNNPSKFILQDVSSLTGCDLLQEFGKAGTKILVGCAPCQPFSRYAQSVNRSGDQKWVLLDQFWRLVSESGPTIVSMENVPELARHSIFKEFVRQLKEAGFFVSFSNVYCPDYGIPQQRTRLVLLASLLGDISLLPRTHLPAKYRTVKQAIEKLPILSRGEVNAKDSLHRACKLSELNVKRILASKPGGCWRDWPAGLVAQCHQQESGKTYPSVYGRMEWDCPSPTITTQFFGFGNGRFGHPEQDRAISLREGAILQSFPRSYQFAASSEEVSFAKIGRLIGNAVPVRLGEIIGKTIINHIASQNDKKT